MRYLCRVAYDGSYFYGFQRQNKLRTVQGDIESALRRIYGKHVDIHSSSRTDTGVHALDQAFHYDVDILIPEEKLQFIINEQLPEEICILSVILVKDNFHARYNTIEKMYRYDILLSNTKMIFNSRYALIYKKNIDFDYIQKLTNLFIGKRDYKALMASGSFKENTVRTIKKFEIIQKKENLISIYISSDGFLYRMVRIIVGAVLDFNEKKRSYLELEQGLANKDRSVFRRTAPASGLYLEKIYFDEF